MSLPWKVVARTRDGAVSASKARIPGVSCYVASNRNGGYDGIIEIVGGISAKHLATVIDRVWYTPHPTHDEAREWVERSVIPLLESVLAKYPRPRKPEYIAARQKLTITLMELNMGIL